MGDSSEIPADLLKDTLDLIEGTSPSYENIYILLPDGRALSSTHPDLVHIQAVHGREVIERLRSSDKPVLGPVYQYPEKEGGTFSLRQESTDRTRGRLPIL